MMRFLTRVASVAAILIYSMWAHGISRSGGGKMESFELGFEADIPANYPRVNPVVNRGLRLWSGVTYGTPTISADSFVELREFEIEFPELSTFDRPTVTDKFADLTWTRIKSPATCLEAFEKKTATVHSVVVLWGPGRGVVILSGRKPSSESAMNEIIGSISLSPGSCQW